MSGWVEPDDLSLGAVYFVYCPEDDDWSLWEHTSRGRRLHVNWRGEVRDDVPLHRSHWERDRFHAYPVLRENLDAYVMAARHMRDAEQWYRFARRQAEQGAISRQVVR